MELSEVLQARYSVRKYEKKEVEEEKIAAILEAARIAPTAKNLQPVKIHVVKGEEMEKLAKATKCTFGAPLAFVVAVGGECYERFYDKKQSYDTDAAIVATYMMLRATDLGLGTCYVMAYQPDLLKAEFPCLANYASACILICGYAAEDSVPSERHGSRKALGDILL